MRAIVLSIGDELVLGQTVDTNSAWVSQRLARLGVMTLSHVTVADDQHAIAAAAARAAEACDLLVITGGLGPTDDDLTRQALAEAHGVELVTHEPSIRHIAAFFEKRGRTMPERNKVQALHPRGVEVITNHWGTAPGLEGQLQRAHYFVFPGVPREMFAMFERYVEPWVRENSTGNAGRVILARKINTFGWGESDVAVALGDLMARDRNPLVGTTVSGGVVACRLRSEFATLEEATAQLEDTAAQVERALGPIVYGRDDDTLSAALLQLLIAKDKTVATAESCTGGLVGAMLTDTPGSSAAYRGGWVTYTNELKVSELGVAVDLLCTHGAVSAECAAAMALGARRRAGSDYALSLTGVAGPDGGSTDKPVGTVWVALADEHGATPVLLQLAGDRTAIRDRAAKCALQLLRLHLLGEPFDTLRWGRVAGR